MIDITIGKKKAAKTNQIRSGRKVYFSFLPAAANAPGGGKVVVTSINAAFYLGEPATTNLSNVFIVPVTDFSSRFGLYLKPNIWISGNSWNLTGDYRIVHYPQYTWGLGGNTQEGERTLINSDYFRFYQNALKKISGNWYGGAGFALDYYYNIEEAEIETTGHLEEYPIPNAASSVSSGIMLTALYDSRVNPLNPQRGGYLNTTLRLNMKGLGSDFNQQSLFIDGRKYYALPSGRKCHVLSFRGFYWTVLDGDTPYLDLPSIGWAPASGIAGRGFQAGRYRSNAMVYGEVEQRFSLTRNGLLGVVLFGNVQSVSEFKSQQFRYWHAGGGIGLRVKMNKYSGANIAVDFGFSSDYWSVWLNIGEVF